MRIDRRSPAARDDASGRGEVSDLHVGRCGDRGAGRKRTAAPSSSKAPSVARACRCTNRPRNLLHAVRLYQDWNHPSAERNIKHIPQGVHGLLTLIWQRVMHLPQQLQHHVMVGPGVLTAAREAISLADLERLAGWADSNVSDQFLGVARSFLLESPCSADQSHHGYRLFHTVMQAFLDEHLHARMPSYPAPYGYGPRARSITR